MVTCISGGGGNVIHDFRYLGKGGGKGETISKYFTLDLFTFSDNIYYTRLRFHVFSSILS